MVRMRDAGCQWGERDTAEDLSRGAGFGSDIYRVDSGLWKLETKKDGGGGFIDRRTFV